MQFKAADLGAAGQEDRVGDGRQVEGLALVQGFELVVG
jgi:hypothetical protein